MNHQPSCPFKSTTRQPSACFDTLGKNLPEPYELVAETGDVMFMHHLILHEGNHSHSANRKQRVALDCDAWHDPGLIEIDPQHRSCHPGRKWPKNTHFEIPLTIHLDHSP